MLKRHNLKVTDPLFKSLEQKVLTLLLWRFNKNRIHEQIHVDDKIMPVKTASAEIMSDLCAINIFMGQG